MGFKSFADKTSIKFDDGVTCIVGPNGCGKSNVADAVRWVLGEQSAKSLRGSSMQDVIFNGTESRRALSYCEVTLVFDNASRMFDIDYEEVAMTRRLYRSGESEYLLNKQPCRLKDIVALLHGVGIGKEGYSIIGQGKVEQIMNAKPEDRRAIFEEATGVMKFKAQKGEIERKLESAKDNLTVFVQRMDEAEKQLRPLEKQAETAKKYRAYSDQLKYEEVNTYLLRCDNFAFETGKHRERIQKAEKRLAAIRSESDVIDEEDRLAREEIARADDTLRALNEKLRAFEVGFEHKSGEARLIGERMAAVRRRAEQASLDEEASLGRIAEIARLLEAGQKKTQAGTARAREIEKQCSALMAKVHEAEAHLEAYERISDEKRASELSSVENLADVRASAGSLSAQKTAASERIEEVRTALERAGARKREFSDQLSLCRTEKEKVEAFFASQTEREEELTETLRELARSGQKLSQEYIDCNTSIANYTNNLEFYKNLKNRFDGYRDSVRNLQLKAQKDPALGDRIKGAIADIVSTEQKYEVAIETAFGGAMQNLVTATADDARYLIEYLKRTGGGVVTFLPVAAIRPRANSGEIRRALREEGALGLADELVRYDPYYGNVICNLLGNTLVCDTIASATQIAKKYPRAFRIVTLDGDIIATSGAMTGGSKRKESGNLLAGERRIKECEDAIARKRITAEKLKAAADACEQERGKAEAAIAAFRSEVQTETASRAALAQKELALTDLISDAERDIAEYGALLQQLEQKVAGLESEALSAAESEDVLNRIRTEAAAEAAARQAESGKLRQERDKLNEEIAALRVESAAIVSARAAEEENAKRLTDERETLSARITADREEKERTVSELSALKEQAEKVALSDEDRAAINAVRAEISRSEEEKRQKSAEQEARSERKRALLEEQQQEDEKRHRSELEISKAEAALENMKQRIDEAYGLSYESAQELRDENYDVSQSYNNINSLKRKISALGPVNMNAEEDYELLFGRYSEMQTQKEDLEKGIFDLTTVLNDLRDAMQKQFDDGFNEINQNFTVIFKELFGGGKAEMQLDYTDCDDPLNAGIEIVACPPGKKLTKISLLSGGERAFTAIAILFAILKSRPMPFCILDEIEAALDEANVDRFAKYLQKFSKETQFIVITHRKPTMNRADTLFGVTMEEKGVSKIVSVKLSEVEERLGGDTVIA